jgi:hypothetical protein
MIVVTVELWKKGDPERREVLGVARISNDASGSKARGNYDAVFMGKRNRVISTGRVFGFPRARLLAWDLVFRALRACFESRNPKASPGSDVLSGPLGRLRHAYENLCAPAAPWRLFGHDYKSDGSGACGKCGHSRGEHGPAEFNRRAFADGLIAPVIRELEELQRAGLTTESGSRKVV